MNTADTRPRTPGAYVPPVDEYAFLLAEAFGTDLIARATDGALTAEDMTDALRGAAEFAAEVFAPLDRRGDREGIRIVDGEARTPAGFPEAYRQFAEAGWVSAAAPASAGGDDLPASVQGALTEFWNGANAAFGLNPALSAGAIHALDAAASPELRETYLTRLVSGEWTGTMNLTEPQAGTDLGAIRTIARPNGDGSWAIRGQKIFITWGDHDVADNIVHLVLARTEGAPEGSRGLSLFVAPKRMVDPDGTLGERNAITTVSVEHKIGIHASPTCVLDYDDATGYLVGELHQGLAGMFVMMNSARLGIAMQALGIADRALQRARDFADVRVQGRVLDRPSGAPIAEHPDVRRLLLSMSSTVTAMRALAVHVGDLRDRSGAEGDRAAAEDNATLVDFFVPIVKGWFTEEAVRIASDAVQVHGGMGYVEETGAAQHYRDARILPIYEGTTAIQANDLVGRKVLRDGGASVRRVLAAASAQADALRAREHPVARRTAERLTRAVQSAERATAALLGFADRPRDAFAAGVPYLMLLGALTGGWMHATIVGAVLDHDLLTAEDERRLTEADFFGAHHLVAVHALVETVEAGEIA